jgi:hypothetical protein
MDAGALLVLVLLPLLIIVAAIAGYVATGRAER